MSVKVHLRLLSPKHLLPLKAVCAKMSLIEFNFKERKKGKKMEKKFSLFKIEKIISRPFVPFVK